MSAAVDQFLRKVFLSEIEMQCQLIATGAAELDRARAIDLEIGERMQVRPESAEALRQLSDESRASIARQWFVLQGILIAAAGLQKLFWGSGGKKKEERRSLRELLGVSDDSCLHDPNLRNDFEHFDERIECRIAKQGNTGYIARNIAPMGEDFHVGEEPNSRFGHYDPETGDVSFWAHSVNVFEIVTEAREIFKLAETESMKPFWVEESGPEPAEGS